MGKIKILDEQVVNKIAAGEVVERPASIVKELLDNAIDAGAENIEVKVLDGGIKRILVTDDGLGMDKDDLNKSYLRYGTSKINSMDDLWNLSTLGFRGEALASIAAVSKMTMASKTKSSLTGYQLTIEGGKASETTKVGMPTGTKIEVDELFYNTPARRKFLKSMSTEKRHITDEVISHALGHPKVSFKLDSHKSNTLFYSSMQDRFTRVKQVLGVELADQLIKISFDHAYVKINGWIGKPQSAHNSKYKQYLLVNNRRISDRGLSSLVKKSFGSLLPPKVYPVFIIYIDVAAEMVDVNTHPRKEEVKFMDSNLVYSGMSKAIRYALQNSDLTFQLKSSFSHSKEQFGEVDNKDKHNLDKGRSTYKKNNFGPQLTVGEKQMSYEFNKPIKYEMPALGLDSDDDVSIGNRTLQVHNLFLFKETTQGIVIVDQHAAHERILFEKFLKNFQNERFNVGLQEMLIPIKLSLTPDEKEVFISNKKVFENLGFKFLSDGDSWEVSHIPVLLADKSIIRIVKEVLEDIIENRQVREIDDESLKVVTYMSCRSAVKAGDKLSDYEKEQIFLGINEDSGLYTCPHGRPVKVELSLKELRKMFHRV